MSSNLNNVIESNDIIGQNSTLLFTGNLSSCLVTGTSYLLISLKLRTNYVIILSLFVEVL